MAAIELEGELLGESHGKVRRKGNSTHDLKSKAKRVAKGSTEVMVKITGFGKGAGHVKAHLDYISRNGKLELETNRGEILEGKEEIHALFKNWAEDFSDGKKYANRRDTMHMVLSMPEGTPQESVRDGARAFAARTFGKNHDYVFALHTDEPHPHVHITVKMLGFDGTRLNPRKADLQGWREGFALAMRDQGEDAEASPRSIRGVVKKPERSVLIHIEKEAPDRPKRVSRVKAAQVKQAADELSAEAQGRVVVPGAWEKKIEARRERVKAAWNAEAEKLGQDIEPKREKVNERPDYDRLDPERTRAGQRAAFVYQSNLESDGLKAPAAALASVRNLPGRAVVQHQRPAQVLLYANAPGRLGRHSAADHDVRRAGVGTDGTGSGTDAGVTEAKKRPASQVLGAELAERIRGLVAEMPEIETRHQSLKKRLRVEFGAAPSLQGKRDQGAGLAGAAKVAEPAKKDIER